MVYVDRLPTMYGVRPLYHMIGEDEQELSDMAKLVGLRPVDIQLSSGGVMHFHLSMRQRNDAIAAGAEILSKPDMEERLEDEDI